MLNGGEIEPRSTVLRFNVSDLEAAAAELESKGCPVGRLSFEWGRIGVFNDPDGSSSVR